MVYENKEGLCCSSRRLIGHEEPAALWAWGASWYGQLGDGTGTDRGRRHLPLGDRTRPARGPWRSVWPLSVRRYLPDGSASLYSTSSPRSGAAASSTGVGRS